LAGSRQRRADGKSGAAARVQGGGQRPVRAARAGTKKEAADKARREADEAASKAEEEQADRELEEEERKTRKALEAEKRKIEAEVRKARQQAELAKARAEIEKLKAGASGGGADGMPSGFRTIELFGQISGQNVPLSQVLTQQGGGFAVVPGGAVLGGESPGEGFGYGGMPGRWAEASGGQPPTAYGQDAAMGIVGFDGARAWPVPASTLAQIFGANWRGSLS
jgi:multidrug efflux pump subunit AcrA (membrane-fusion protein)